jgi:hypothetical protein
VQAGKVYSLRWKVPAKLKAGPADYCVQARDPAGNRSRSCATVKVT